MNLGFKRSVVVWGLLYGAGLVGLIFEVMPWQAALGALFMLLYEGYTFIDPYMGDTLSEAQWYLSRRPLIPLLTGIAVGAALIGGLLSNPVLCVGIGMLLGHFYWQTQDVYERKVEEEVKAAVAAAAAQ